MLTSKRPAVIVSLAATILALFAWVGSTTQAFAHDYLVSSNPAANSTQHGALSQVALRFGEPMLTTPAPPVVQVVGSGGKHYETGCTQTHDTLVSVPVALGADGTYTVTWRVVSDDGHPVTGTFTFTYVGGGAAVATGSVSAPNCKAGQPQAATSTAPATSVASSSAAPPVAGTSSASAATSHSGTNSSTVAIIVGAVVVLAALAAALFAMRRRQSHD